MSTEVQEQTVVTSKFVPSRQVNVGGKTMELIGVPESAEKLLALVANKDYTGETQAQIEAEIVELRKGMTVYPLPPFIIKHTFYFQDEAKTQLTHIKFAVKGTGSSYKQLPEDNTFKVVAGKNLYRDLMDNLIAFFHKYYVLKAARKNVTVLNAKIRAVAKKHGVKVPKNLTFTTGVGFPLVTSNEMHIAVDNNTLADLISSILFASSNEEGEDLQSQNAESLIISYLTSLTSYEAFTAQTAFTKMLNIPKQSMASGIRANLNRRLAVARATNMLGTVYATGIMPVERENGETFDLRIISIVERVAMTPDEVEALKANEVYAPFFENGSYIVEENTEPNKPLREAGKTQILSYLTLPPVAANIESQLLQQEGVTQAPRNLTFADVIRLEEENYKVTSKK